MSLSSTMISLSSYQLPCPLIQQSVLLVTQRRESLTPSPMISPGIYELLTRILSSPNSNRGNCECTAVRSKNRNTRLQLAILQSTIQRLFCSKRCSQCATDLCGMRAHYDPHPLSGHAHNACIASRAPCASSVFVALTCSCIAIACVSVFYAKMTYRIKLVHIGKKGRLVQCLCQTRRLLYLLPAHR